METFCWGIIEGIWMFEMLLLLMNGMVLIPIGSLAIAPVWFDCRARDRRFGEGVVGYGKTNRLRRCRQAD